MNKHLREIWYGLTAFAVVGSPAAYPNVRDGFVRDCSRLNRDKNRVVEQFNHNIKDAVYGEQKYSIKG